MSLALTACVRNASYHEYINWFDALYQEPLMRDERGASIAPSRPGWGQRVECELGCLARGSDACARLKVVDDCRRLDGLRDFAEMAVMGEVDHLARGGHSGE
jgi:hypothetical protein